MKKRVFIAIDLPKEVKETFIIFLGKVKDVHEVKWEKPEKLHLTLVFLGRATENQTLQLVSILDSIVSNQKSLNLSIVPFLSGFPTPSTPRVLWLPIEGELTTLQAVVNELQKILKDNNFRFDERTFHPHLTIGRFRNGVKKWQKQKVLKTIEDALPKRSIMFTVEGLTLFESTLSPKGSVYNVLHYANFGH